MRKVIFFILTALMPAVLPAQELAGLYKQADGFRAKYDSLYCNKILSVNPVKQSNSFWYLIRTKKGNEFHLIQADKKKSIPAFDQERLAGVLKKNFGKSTISAYELPFRSIEFNKTMDTITFSIDNEKYHCSLKNYKVVKRKKEEPRRGNGDYWGRFNRADGDGKILSPDRKKEAYISEGNLWITDLETRKSKKLSCDGTAADYYSSEIHWSPDSKKIVCVVFAPEETANCS